jgi:hypothetical protein
LSGIMRYCNKLDIHDIFVAGKHVSSGMAGNGLGPSVTSETISTRCILVTVGFITLSMDRVNGSEARMWYRPCFQISLPPLISSGATQMPDSTK